MRRVVQAVSTMMAFLLASCSLTTATPAIEVSTPRPFLSPATNEAPAPGPSPTPGLARAVSHETGPGGITIETRSVGGWLPSQAATNRTEVSIAIAIPILSMTGEGGAATDALSRSIVGDIIDANLPANDSASQGRLAAIALELGSTVYISVSYDLSYAIEGIRMLRPAPHGDSIRRGVNIDRANGRILNLADLFMPGSPYLVAISEYCENSFKASGLIYAPKVVAPSPANYSNWVLGPAGLVVFFDGGTLTGQSINSPQIVVPYLVLKPYLAANGVADRLARGEP